MKLYEMTESVAALCDMLEEGQIDEQTLSDTLEGMDFTRKIESCCQILQQLKANAEAAAKEKERLAKLEDSAKKGKERISAYLERIMFDSKLKKIQAGTFNVSLRMSEFVAVTDESKISDCYFTIKKVPNKKAIKEAIKSGETVDGARLAERESVIIR